MREAVAVLRQEYGDTPHPELADALTNLAGPLMRSSLAEAAGEERLAEADSLLTEALEMYRATVGDENWLVGYAYSNLSVVKTKEGDIETAGELLAESVRVTRLALGDDHPRLAAPLSNLARNLLRQKRYDEAETAYAEALAVARECFGEHHLYVSHPLTGYADLYAETGRYEEAVRAAREGWEIRRDVLGASHSLVIETRVQLAGILAMAGRHDDAIAHLDAAIADARSGLPDTRAVLASALLGRAREGNEIGEDRTAVEPLLDEALAIRLEEYGDDDERTREVREVRERAVAAGG
jgi:tetratricopeptide (TPR) repeat protein